MRQYNINANLIKMIKSLYDKATSTVYFNSNIGDWFRTTVGVRQGCLLSPTLFNIFLERIMADALEDHEGTVSAGGRTILNLYFADDIVGLAEKEEELANLVECLDKISTFYGMQINAEKTKQMTNNIIGFTTDIRIGGEKLNSFKYLGAIVTDEGSKPEILTRIAQTKAELTKLKTIWSDRNIAFSSKIRLMHSLIMSIFLYASETWTLTAELESSGHGDEMLQKTPQHLL
uniref:Reverse transcriptase domain-containing protein n=1 Tax=Cyprinus carpio TaxID=7962 RepID=A0A8C2JTE1_CYPCA